jgi:hypothetical protein
MIQNRCLRMMGKYNVNFLHADFSVLKLAEYLQLLAINTYEKLNFHPNKLITDVCRTY